MEIKEIKENELKEENKEAECMRLKKEQKVELGQVLDKENE